jgi:hypothetical protein
MNLWLAAFISLLCALAGVGLGLWFSRLRSPYWMIGYFVPIVLIFLCVAAFNVPAVLFAPPASWMLMGLKKFAVFGFDHAIVPSAAKTQSHHDFDSDGGDCLLHVHLAVSCADG